MTTPPLLAKARETQMPLPEGVTEFGIGPSCFICHSIEVAHNRRLMTCSVETNPRGLHDIQSHEIWCPVVNTAQPVVACPECGSEVEGFEHRPGYSVKVDWPAGHTVIGTADEVFNHPDLQFGASPSPTKREPNFDEVTVSPCEHTLKGEDAHTVLRAHRQYRDDQHAAEVAATLNEHAELLAWADENSAAVAEKYRQAVATSSRDAAGLLVALNAMRGA